MEEEIVEAHKCLLCGCWTCHVGSLCEECYKNLDETIQCEDGVVLKKDLQLKKNTTRYDEDWVTCFQCKKKFHTICVLFNSKIAERDKHCLFVCPFCMQSHPEWRLRVNVPAVLPRAESFICDWAL